jgi:hypothetical protein
MKAKLRAQNVTVFATQRSKPFAFQPRNDNGKLVGSE